MNNEWTAIEEGVKVVTNVHTKKIELFDEEC